MSRSISRPEPSIGLTEGTMSDCGSVHMSKLEDRRSHIPGGYKTIDADSNGRYESQGEMTWRMCELLHRIVWFSAAIRPL